jgi:hypothetical protein
MKSEAFQDFCPADITRSAGGLRVSLRFIILSEAKNPRL